MHDLDMSCCELCTLHDLHHFVPHAHDGGEPFQNYFLCHDGKGDLQRAIKSYIQHHHRGCRRENQQHNGSKKVFACNVTQVMVSVSVSVFNSVRKSTFWTYIYVYLSSITKTQPHIYHFKGIHLEWISISLVNFYW